MTDATPALQATLYNALKTILEDVSPSICSVHDFVPEDEAFPYVVIGEFTTVDDGSKSKAGQEHTVTIHIWDQATNDTAGRLRSRQIVAHIYDALHLQSLSISGQTTVSCRFDYASGPDLDADGRTMHAV